MTEIPDHVWLASDEAIPYLEECRTSNCDGVNIIRTAKRLRRSISPSRAAMVMELTNLRHRGRIKFSRAEHMFFTQRSLQQSTGESLALYKASRFAGCNSIADICCGIGGDAIALSQKAALTGVDRDEMVGLFAQKNLQAYQRENSSIESIEFNDFELNGFDGVHLDPDRRNRGRKTLGDFFQPPLPEIIQRVPKKIKTAIKVAPATPIHASVPSDAELEWIGEGRECKQQIIWLNGAQRIPGARVASVVKSDVVTSFVAGQVELETPQDIANEVGDYVYEPHSTLLAAGLTDAFAAEFGLKRLFQDVVYLTGDKLIENRLLARFKTVEVLPMNALQTAEALQRLGAGTVEFKKRLIGNAYYEPFTRIKTVGSEPFTVLLSPIAGGSVAIIARRIPH